MPPPFNPLRHGPQTKLPFILDSEVRMGGTGYQPVPSGYQPDGILRTHAGQRGTEKFSCVRRAQDFQSLENIRVVNSRDWKFFHHVAVERR